ncbi:hypothetical protein LTSEMIN_1247, partial [Salmonella enterica subsp. enterica serovar Minnesota str. A4-603]
SAFGYTNRARGIQIQIAGVIFTSPDLFDDLAIIH